MEFEKERVAAVQAVIKASRLCQRVQTTLVSADSMAKKDKSPVTVADYGSQAIIISHLGQQFAHFPVVAEEDATELRLEENDQIRESVTHHVQSIQDGLSPDDVLDAIDGGNYPGGSQGTHWTLDPIDGTKGFLRGDQYAVALGLIQDGQVVLGVLGCPNLQASQAHDDRKGCLFVAVKGQGACVRRMDSDEEIPVRVTSIDDPTQASFCESVESAHSKHSHSQRVAELLGVTAPPYRIDSQCKYGAVSRGDCSVYLRLPTRADYVEKIWDHAAGWMVVTEAGGLVSDVAGNPLDFSSGRTLAKNRGVVATNGLLHDRVIEAVGQVLNANPRP